MSIRIKRCPFCNISVKNKKKLCKNNNNKPISCIKVHSKKLNKKAIQYRCTNYKGHGWTEDSLNDKKWYYITFYDKPILNNKNYLYQNSILHNSDTFIKEHKEFAKLDFDTEILDSIRSLDKAHPIKEFFQIYLPEILELNRKTIHIPETFGKHGKLNIHDLRIILYHLKGFSIDLIIKILFASNRIYVANTIQNFMNEIKTNKLSLNCSFKYYPSKNKIIESKYYNKYKIQDFKYIN